MGLRIGDIAFGSLQRLFQRRGADGTGGNHGSVELTEADRGKLAHETGEIGEMMRRRGMRYTRLTRHRPQRQPWKPVALKDPLGRFELKHYEARHGGTGRRDPVRPPGTQVCDPCVQARQPSRDVGFCS